MEYNTSELCDLYADMIDVVEPIFANYGGRRSFGGRADQSSEVGGGRLSVHHLSVKIRI